jgi:tetratricopeptide (TPR) repeat protein
MNPRKKTTNKKPRQDRHFLAPVEVQEAIKRLLKKPEKAHEKRVGKQLGVSYQTLQKYMGVQVGSNSKCEGISYKKAKIILERLEEIPEADFKSSTLAVPFSSGTKTNSDVEKNRLKAFVADITLEKHRVWELTENGHDWAIGFSPMEQERVWDTSAIEIYRKCANFEYYSKYFRLLNTNRDWLNANCNEWEKLYVARWLSQASDMSYANEELVEIRENAAYLGMSLIAPLTIYNENSDVAHNARILNSQILRCLEGEAWSIPNVPKESESKLSRVIKLYQDSNHHIEIAAGGGPTSQWSQVFKNMQQINHICMGRSYIQMNKYKEAEMWLDRAAEIHDPEKPVLKIYKSHLSYAKGERDHALTHLNNAIAESKDVELTFACQARMFEISGGSEHREKMTIARTGQVGSKFADVFSKKKVSLLLTKNSDP